MWVRGVISLWRQRLMLGSLFLCVCTFLEEVTFLVTLWEGEKGQPFWGYPPPGPCHGGTEMVSEGLEVSCSLLTLPSPWVRGLCWGRAESIKKGDCTPQARGLLPWYAEVRCSVSLPFHDVKCSALLCYVCIRLEWSYKNYWVVFCLPALQIDPYADNLPLQKRVDFKYFCVTMRYSLLLIATCKRVSISSLEWGVWTSILKRATCL